jgi:hypothetical protein
VSNFKEAGKTLTLIFSSTKQQKAVKYIGVCTEIAHLLL